MNILVFYGTTEGQTRKIAQFMRDRLVATGYGVRLVDATEPVGDLSPRMFDAVVVAASVHLGRYQTAVEDAVRRWAADLNTMRAAFVSVSLAAAGHDRDDIEGLAQCVAEFRQRTGWTPAALHHAAGAFKYTEYDFFKRWALKYIAWRKGAPTDATRDWELTDWQALGQFVDAFAEGRSGPQPGA